MQNLGLLHDQIPGLSVPIYVSPVSKIHFLQIIFNIFQPFLSWFSSGTFPSGIFLDPFFRFFPPDILSTCSNHRSFPCLMYEIIFVSSYRSIESCLLRILHTPFEKLSHSSLFCVTTKYSGICGPKMNEWICQFSVQ